MRYAIIEAGKIMGFREIPGEDIEIIAHYRKTETLVEAGDDIQADSHYYTDGMFREIPERPSPYHEWVPGTASWMLDDVRAWRDIRGRRDKLLSESDWAILPDVPLSEEQKIEVKTYRQALRDITAQPDLGNIIWPEKPEVIK